MNEMLEYLLAAISTVAASILGWVLYRIKQRDKEIAELRRRVTVVEIDTGTRIKVLEVKLEAIKEDTKEMPDGPGGSPPARTAPARPGTPPAWSPCGRTPRRSVPSPPGPRRSIRQPDGRRQGTAQGSAA